MKKTHIDFDIDELAYIYEVLSENKNLTITDTVSIMEKIDSNIPMSFTIDVSDVMWNKIRLSMEAYCRILSAIDSFYDKSNFFQRIVHRCVPTFGETGKMRLCLLRSELVEFNKMLKRMMLTYETFDPNFDNQECSETTEEIKQNGEEMRKEDEVTKTMECLDILHTYLSDPNLLQKYKDLSIEN